jgi:hypothetical protein
LGLPFLVISSSRIKMPVSSYLKTSVLFSPDDSKPFVGLIIWEVSVRVPYYKFINRLGWNSHNSGILTKQIIINKLLDWAD